MGMLVLFLNIFFPFQFSVRRWYLICQCCSIAFIHQHKGAYFPSSYNFIFLVWWYEMLVFMHSFLLYGYDMEYFLCSSSNYINYIIFFLYIVSIVLYHLHNLKLLVGNTNFRIIEISIMEVVSVYHYMLELSSSSSILHSPNISVIFWYVNSNIRVSVCQFIMVFSWTLCAWSH